MANDYSRDETEFGGFGDSHVSQSLTSLPTFGGLFSSILKKVVKKPVQTKVSAQLTAKGATQAQIDSYNRAAAKAQPTAKDVAVGVGKSAIMLAPIVATAGGGALLAAPAVAAAAPFAKSVISSAAPVARGVAPIVASAKPLVSSALQIKAPTSINPALIAAAAAAGHISVDAAKKMIAGQAAVSAPAPAPAKPAPAPAKPAPAPAPAPAMTPGALQMLTNTLVSLIRTQKTAAASATVQKMFDAAASKLPSSAANNAARAAQQARLDDARREVGLVPLSNVVKYLVLDSGQVLSDQAAQQKLSGFAVRVDGSVARQ